MSKGSCFVKLCGGIGNQLFQVAAGFAYSLANNKNFFIDSSEWTASQGQNPNAYEKTIFKNFAFRQAPQTQVSIIDEKEFNFNHLPFVQGDVILRGYFQSMKYFEKYKKDFLSTLILPKVKTTFDESVCVAMHIRRGDYLAYSKIHLVCNTQYFLNFFEKYSLEKFQINVFTDSPQFILQEFKNINYKLIQTKSEIHDLSLMSKHKVIVGSNSSFSWWASLIGNNECYFPNKWFADNRDCNDVYRNDMNLVKTE